MMPRTSSGLSVTHTGTPATIRPGSRPASAAALAMAGAMSVSIVRGPLSHRMFPSAVPPASSSIRGPMAASSTGGAATSGGPPVAAAKPDQISPVASTDRSRSAGSKTARYSSMCWAGWANGMRSPSSITLLCASPMPNARRPPAMSDTVSAWAASINGWRSQVAITAVPSSMVDVARPAAPSTVRASGTASWATQYDAKPSRSASTAWSMISETGRLRAMRLEPLMPMRIPGSCRAGYNGAGRTRSGAVERGEFKGRIGRYHWESEAYWPPEPSAPPGAPNVLIVLLDDVGFAQLGCFGSDIATPTFDGLAASGLRYANFHTTGLCSPTRACVLTGRNHHSCGMGRIVELAAGFPGYDARIPRSCGLLPAMLTPLGYAAYAVGKWHLTPDEEEHLGARRDRWPLGRGFERFYGFFGGETHQYVPALLHDNHVVEPPGRYEDGYHLTEDLASRAIEFLDDLRHVDVDKPWLMYFAPGACHSPHQAPADWIARYRGHFDGGWDRWRDDTIRRQIDGGLLPAHTELSPRPDWVPAWATLGEAERRVYARYMEPFAGYLSHTDAQVGRLGRWLDGQGELDRTLVLLLSDNGASSEGGPRGSLNDARTWNMLSTTVEEADARLDEIGGPRIHNNYPWGWTVAGNTPFRRWKRETHEGGVADPLVVSWPAGITARGEVRRQYVHAIDLVPTILEVIGAEAPSALSGIEQRPLEGVSFAHSFDGPEAADRHPTQYYEMFGCRAI